MYLFSLLTRVLVCSRQVQAQLNCLGGKFQSLERKWGLLKCHNKRYRSHSHNVADLKSQSSTSIDDKRSKRSHLHYYLQFADSNAHGATVAVNAIDVAFITPRTNCNDDYTWLLFGHCRPTCFFLGPCCQQQQQLLIQCRFAEFSELEA